MLNIGVVFGGRAVEHEVSVITGIQAIENLNKNKYNIIPIFIDKDGKMWTGNCYKDFKSFKTNKFDDKKSCFFKSEYGDKNLYIDHKKMFSKTEIVSIDVVLFALHGTHGEDGALQGLFETNGICYTGPNVLSSAIGMDKVIMKDILKSYGIKICEYKSFYRNNFLNNKNKVVDDLVNEINFPMIVKPSNLGSSIGIKVARNNEELIEAIEVAINFDEKIIVENFIENCTEMNVAIMGNYKNYEISEVEVPDAKGDMLTFENKYVSGESKSKITGGKHVFLEDKELSTKIKNAAEKTFLALNASGNVRVDILLDKNNEIYVNEINTLPGSFGFYLWEESGYTFSSLLDRVIEIALEMDDEKHKTNFRFDYDLFNKTGFGSKL